MNILFYCDEYPPALNGGIGSVVKVVAESLAARKHHIYVVGDYSSLSNVDEVSEINNVTIIRLSAKKYKTIYIRSLKLISAIVYKFTKNEKIKADLKFLIAKQKVRLTEKYVQQIIDKNKIDIVELPDYRDALFHDLIKPIQVSKFNIPTVVRVHGSASFISHYFKHTISDAMLKNDIDFFEKADRICAVSNFSANFVQDRLLNRSVDVIYNPIEDLFFEGTKPLTGNKNILFFGKIVETKGAYSLLKAFNLVAEKVADTNLILVGNGNLETAKNLVQEQYHNRVHFKGFMPKERLRNEIDNAYICVMPSYFENFSMAALEVQARSRALIFTERSSGKELIEDGVNGWLVDPLNIEQIAAKIIFALENPAKTSEMAQNGYETCKKRFSTSAIIPQLEAYYTTIIAENNK